MIIAFERVRKIFEVEYSPPIHREYLRVIPYDRMIAGRALL
jgi:hypothetical protein